MKCWWGFIEDKSWKIGLGMCSGDWISAWVGRSDGIMLALMEQPWGICVMAFKMEMEIVNVTNEMVLYRTEWKKNGSCNWP